MTLTLTEDPRNHAELWDNGSGPGGAGNTTRSLTHSLDVTKEGLAMNATRTTPEIWKPVPGWEGFYEASTHGNVRSVPRTVQRKGQDMRLAGRTLKPSIHHSGYRRVNLTRPGHRSEQLLHWIIARTFHGERPANLEVRHINGNQAENRATNLAYGTSAENSLDTVEHGNNHLRNRTHCPANHPLEEPNLVASETKRGHRKCRACNSAHAKVHRNPALADQFQVIADDYFTGYTAARDLVTIGAESLT